MNNESFTLTGLAESAYKEYNILSKTFGENSEEESLKEAASISSPNTTNVVEESKLRVIQKNTLNDAAKYLSKTFGPMGSNTKIVTGKDYTAIDSSYSKDGLKVLSKIMNSGVIEASIISELENITRHVEKEVGDGTTSTVILTSLIFEKLIAIQKNYNIPPYQLIRKFEKVADDIKEEILSHKRDCTVEDIYNISMISTNGNEEVSNNIKKIYEDYGMDVELSVSLSTTENSMIKVFDGLTIKEGYASPAYITNLNSQVSEIHNARVYHFADPIDNDQMISWFKAIITNNIFEKIKAEEEPVPTVITCPRISNDMEATMKEITQFMFGYSNEEYIEVKPQLLIITNVVASDELIMDDIANLCGCKSIRKYIDPKILEKDQQDGIAPTIETVADFYGTCELVSADAKSTKFINPAHMRKENSDEFDDIYLSMVAFLENAIKEESDQKSSHDIMLLKKRLAALKSNMVEYLVGGITITDKEATKDLVEDAIKNCKSAATYGVGYAANYEGLRATHKLIHDNIGDSIESFILSAIYCSYVEISKLLYGTVSYSEKDINRAVFVSIEKGYPINISSGELSNGEVDEHVLGTIMLDIQILDTISKIVSIMVTCNQCLLQGTAINTY
jgi:chaperonin GroEL (HSP60 family)